LVCGQNQQTNYDNQSGDQQKAYEEIALGGFHCFWENWVFLEEYPSVQKEMSWLLDVNKWDDTCE
jgi:hypothetical protein